MTVEIGDIIIDKIKTLPFIDKYSGVVKVVSYKAKNASGAFEKKTFPASCRTTLEECESGRYKDLVPDSSKKSVLYLEDKGARIVNREGSRVFWKSSYDLICWLNMPNLGFAGCSYSGIAISGILSKFPVKPFNNSIFSRIEIQATGIPGRSNNPFVKYSYDESILQFLMYPYDFFVMNIDVDYMVDSKCLTPEVLKPPINCL